MTSGKFQIIPVNSISVVREERQRKELRGIEELAESIRINGLINPITITKDYVLVAGERRLTAHKHLGFDQIAVQFVEDLEDTARHLIELEENVRREDLDWKDHVEAIARYHELRKSEEPSWSQEDTSEALGMSASNVRKHMLVKEALDEGVEEVAEAPKFSTAANFAARRKERSKASTLRNLDFMSKPKPAVPQSEESSVEESEGLREVPSRFVNLEQKDFNRWAKEVVLETPYNFLHCDFPYGVNAGDTRGQSGAKSFGGYEDKSETYFELLNALLANQDRFIAPSAHMIFWFSLDFYQETVDLFRESGWRVDKRPLIWYRSDNSGILPDKDRGPRWIYETALFCTRGDRKIVRAVGNCVAHGATKEYHASEKPKAVLEHFFRMLIDSSTVMLDPTCGSGNAVAVSEQLGAAWSTGFDKEVKYVEGAKHNLDLE